MEQTFVTVNGEKRAASVGTRLSDLFLSETPCGGHGKCGKCKVRATGWLSPVSQAEYDYLTKEELASGIRLACCTTVTGECCVESIASEKKDAVLTGGDIRQTVAAPAFKKLGVAIDIGTTTLAAKMFSPDGEVLSEYGIANPQSVFGADVISRVESSVAGNADALAKTLVSALDEMIIKLAQTAKKNTADVDGIVITGNTTMLYLLTKTSPEPFSHAPFTLTRGFGETLTAASLVLKSVSGEAEVYLPPCISAFIGADTVCALLASDIFDSEKPAMLADIGTNGEMAILADGRLSVCSTAAGPAFEGVGISMGMCGADGAVDKVTAANGRLSAHVIGEGRPVGICGSGVIDAVAALLENEELDETGYLEDDEVEISAPVVLTQQDIRMVQLAKSAICAGLQTLMNEYGIDESRIDTLYIAGGFGNYLDKTSAGRIGLFPRDLVPKVKGIGNAALSGASMLLMNRFLREKAEQIAKDAVTVELSTSKFFSDTFMSGMMFPVE